MREASNSVDHASTSGREDEAWVPTYEHVPPHPMCCEQCKAALTLIRDSGFVFTDPRLDYAEIQVDREAYAALMAEIHGEAPY